MDEKGESTITYQLNEVTKKRKQIREFLKAISFIGDASPFVIYQHSIVNIPFKTPQQLSELILEVSGTKAFNENVRLAKKEIEKWSTARKTIEDNIRLLEERLETEKMNFSLFRRLDELSDSLINAEEAIQYYDYQQEQHAIQSLERPNRSCPNKIKN